MTRSGYHGRRAKSGSKPNAVRKPVLCDANDKETLTLGLLFLHLEIDIRAKNSCWVENGMTAQQSVTYQYSKPSAYTRGQRVPPHLVHRGVEMDDEEMEDEINWMYPVPVASVHIRPHIPASTSRRNNAAEKLDATKMEV
ncbi:hypothetical protein H0H92_003833 [Tricholoma furcatifolium]|nr:hypothetical protein H0H92_003833 [Tricholoma furcatifolium]